MAERSEVGGVVVKKMGGDEQSEPEGLWLKKWEVVSKVNRRDYSSKKIGGL